MTNLVDFDRSLAEFLADGPNTAPEAPVIAALAHARTTPRRPDPLGAFRRDAMAAPRRVFGMRPGFVLAAAALGLALVGVAVVGSSQNQVAPEPSPTPHASGEPTGSPAFSKSVTLLVTAGRPYPISVSDTTGELLDAVSVQPGDGSGVAGDELRIEADPSDPTVLIVTWQGTPCESQGSLVVDERSPEIVVSRERCDGDTLPVDRILRLDFAGDVNPDVWSKTLMYGFGNEPTASVVPPTASDVDFQLSVETIAGRPTLLDVVDDSGHLTAVVGGASTEGDGAPLFTSTNVDARTVEVSWPGSTCDVISRLIVAADFGLRLERPGCSGAPHAVVRTVGLTFDRDVDASAFDTGLAEVGDWSVYPWAVNGTDSVGADYNLRVSPLTAGLENVATMDASTVQPPAESGARLDQAGDAIIELVWTGPACDTAPALNFDTSGTHWLLSESSCTGDLTAVVRRVSLKFDGPRPVGSIQVTLVPAAAGT